LTKHDGRERARAEMGLGTPTHAMRLVQRYLTAAYNRGGKAKRLINKHRANKREAIHPSARPHPKWRPPSPGARGAGDVPRRGRARDHWRRTPPLARPPPLLGAVAPARREPRPAAPRAIPPVVTGGEGVAEAAEVRTEEQRE